MPPPRATGNRRARPRTDSRRTRARIAPGRKRAHRTGASTGAGWSRSPTPGFGHRVWRRRGRRARRAGGAPAARSSGLSTPGRRARPGRPRASDGNPPANDSTPGANVVGDRQRLLQPLHAPVPLLGRLHVARRRDIAPDLPQELVELQPELLEIPGLELPERQLGRDDVALGDVAHHGVGRAPEEHAHLGRSLTLLSPRLGDLRPSCDRIPPFAEGFDLASPIDYLDFDSLLTEEQ